MEAINAASVADAPKTSQPSTNLADMPKTEVAQRGLVLCNIGAGKGKTTAAMGTAIRASGAGMDVCILQFVKSDKRKDEADKAAGEWPLSNEIIFFQNIETKPPLGKIVTEQVGKGFVGILGDNKEKAVHVEAAKNGLKRAKEVMDSGQFQVIVLDEIISGIEVGVLTEEEVAELIRSKPRDLHLIITGHNKFESILEQCDLVTEMKMIKHPYYQGLLAQEGLDY